MEWLQQWQKESKPSTLDFRLAQEIAFGSARMALALDYLAKKLSTTGKVNLKVKERALLRTALYQVFFMDRIPRYALVDETVALAKKYFSSITANFINALLRQIEQKNIKLPEDWSIRYSYPPYYVAILIKQFGKEEAEHILHLGNQALPLTARYRPTQEMQQVNLQEVKDDPNYYIQNTTPTLLFKELATSAFKPQYLLDLCASPGGKLLLAHDYFPNAKLYANDVSEEKLKHLSENIQKYRIVVHLTAQKGEEYKSEQKFDLIILDVPCSNSGVLNKRPEARFRISEEALKKLSLASEKLLKNALSLLSSGGKIWYMTCSILREENEDFVEKMCQKYHLKKGKEKLILPSEEGLDGGYAAELSLS